MWTLFVMKNIGIKRVDMDENTTTNHKAEVSSRCPSSQGVEEWWVACDYVESREAMRHWWENVSIKTKLAQREAFIYSMRIKGVGYKDIMALRFLLRMERTQIVMSWVGWFGRFKWCKTGLKANLSSFPSSRRCS